MAHIEWTDELKLGIHVIDGQHKRIVDYINQLHDARQQNDREVARRVLEDLVDYTFSHFAFEESLMEEAGYDALSIHQQTHRAFRDKVEELRTRCHAGQDVASEVDDLLQKWLIRHIMNDDTSYAPLVKQKMPRIEGKHGGGWLSNTLKRFFG